MESYVVRKGRLEKDPGIDRGPMLVRSEEEWRVSQLCLKKRARKSFWVVLLIILATLLLAYLVVWTFAPDEVYYYFFSFTIITLTIVVVIIFSVVWIGLINRIGKGPTVGLYAEGFEVTDGTFLPYREIREVAQKDVRGPSGREQVVRIWEKERRRNFPYAPVRWTVPVEFLGEEGVRELEQRVHAQGSPS